MPEGKVLLLIVNRLLSYGEVVLTPYTKTKRGQHGPEDKLNILLAVMPLRRLSTLTPVYTSAAASKRLSHEKRLSKTARTSLWFLLLG